jgi:hypothetical protein
VELASEANGYHKVVESDSTGHVVIPSIPYGVYQVRIERPGFALFRENVEIRSEAQSKNECGFRSRLFRAKSR